MRNWNPGVLWRIPLLCAAALAASLLPASSAPLSLYVSPNGDDAATGTAPTPRAATAAGRVGPFATLQRAQTELRALKAAGKLPEGAVVYVRGGIYPLAQPLTFGPEDSGTATHPILYRAYQNDKPILAGARILNGFRPYKGGILRCDLKAAGLGALRFHQLFFRGERMTLARTPNADPKDPHGGTWAHVMGEIGAANKREFKYGDPVTGMWTRPQEGEICLFPSYDWAWNILPLKSVDREKQTITLGRDASYPLRVGDRYFVQNLFEALDAPGEWYLDTQTSTLYFWPPAALLGGQVLAPVTDSVVTLKGAQYVTLQGFTLEACDGDAAQMTDCRGCVVAGCVVRNCGKWGISINGGQQNGAFGNDIYAAGCGGISLNGGDRATLTPGENYATNNYIHHIAAFQRTYNTGINCSGVGNRVDHNLIHDVPHAGLTLSGNENVVEYNTVHHTNLQSGDTGGIYFCSRDWTQRGNIIRYNIFHHVGGFGKANSWQPVSRGKVAFRYPHFTWGIYLDDPTTGTLVYGNILYKVPVCGLHNHGGRDNTFENNVIVDCPAINEGMLDPNWDEWPGIFNKLRAARVQGSPYLQKYPELSQYADTHPEAMTGVKFLRNIVYYTTEGTAWLRGEQKGSWGDGNQLLYQLSMRQEDFPRNEWDYNTIYCPKDLSLRVSLGLSPMPRQMLSWEDWQKQGGDKHSILADPLFVDAAKNDYRLRPESPALKQGFKPIPVEKIGPFADPRRASWPIREAPGASALGDLVTERFVELPEYAPTPATAFAARAGLGNFFAKLAAKKPVRIAYFGGGIAPRDGWRAGVLQWLRGRYPGVTIDEVDAGINDCVRGSGFSVYRFAHDVLAKKPDLVLIDFASDDFQTDPQAIWGAIEGVVRQARKAEPAPEICFLYSFREGFEQDYAQGKSPITVSAYEKLAAHYGIPSIDMGYRVAALAREGKLLLKADAPQAGKMLFSREGVRPLADGNRIYVDAITEALAALAQNAAPVARTLPPPFFAGNLENAKQAPITKAMLQGEWQQLPAEDPQVKSFAPQFDNLWVTTKPGAKLSFKFRGTAVSLFDLMGPDTGQAIVTVDGKQLGVRSQVDPWCTYQRLASLHIADNLPNGEHTVTVELHPDAPDRRVVLDAARKQPGFKPELYQGVALRFAWIRVVGDVIE